MCKVTKKIKYTCPALKLNAIVLFFIQAHLIPRIILDYRLKWHIYLKKTMTEVQKNLVSVKLLKIQRFVSGPPYKIINI